MKTLIKRTSLIAIGTFVVGFGLGWLFFSDSTTVAIDDEHKEHTENTIWTCSMHPQIRQSEPGQCPICGMDLIPLNNESSDTENPMEIKMSPTAMQLANVQTSFVTKQKPVKEIRMNGKVKADERKVSSQTAHIPGRVEKLLVNFTGESVSKGQVLAYVYSPDLVTAQEELFEAYKIRKNQPELFQAAKGKLLNWKLTEKQVNNIIQSGQPQEQFPVLADVSGIVLTKRVNLGDYIQKGQSLFEIADLSNVWVLFDVYESDMQWIRKGDKTSFTIPSMPGETFKGNITFVDPVINPKTRVATARVEMVNLGMKLKPEMFVAGIVKSPIQNEREAIIVPKSAVMWTGERSVVYVKQASVSGINFIMRKVLLGAALGDSYIIKEGLKVGEEIATHGTFSIDAAAQLAGKPSMMNPEGGVVMTGHNHGGGSKPNNIDNNANGKTISISTKAKNELKPVFNAYFKLKDALVNDNLENATMASKEMSNVLSKVNMGVFTGEAHNVWMKLSSALEKELRKANNATEIGKTRVIFKNVSDQMVILIRAFGGIDHPVYIDYCPMSNNNQGAEWLSSDKEIRNPYYGASMLKCGEVKQEIK